MAISRACYCTREDVMRALDFKESARNHAQVDRAIEAGADDVDSLTHRRFYPELATRYFDWPNYQYARTYRLWLDSNEIITATSLVVAGVTIPPTDYFLRRSDDRDEPPYTLLEIDLDSSATLGGGSTHQRAVALSGVYGHSAREQPAGALAEALDSSETGVDVTDSTGIGVGDLIQVDSERMLVIDKTMLDTGVNIDAADSLTANKPDQSITMSTTTNAPVPGEVILIDSERMLVIDRAGSVLTVQRGFDGSTLAAHAAAADIYAPRTLTVARGAYGTTAAVHDTATAITRHVPPGLVRDLNLAVAIEQLQQETSAYARKGGVEDNARNSISVTNIRSNKNEMGIGLDGLRQRTYAAYGRKARIGAV